MDNTEIPQLQSQSHEEAVSKKDKKKRTSIVSISALVIAVVCLIVSFIFIVGSKVNGGISVKLIDGLTGQSIGNVNVKVHSYKITMCEIPPCEEEVQNWSGKSDSNGVINVPPSIVNDKTIVTATGYAGGSDLDKDTVKDGSNWTLELDADSATKKLGRKLKLVDSVTNRPISNVPMLIKHASSTCWSTDCPDYDFKGSTNKLGNVYYSSLPAHSGDGRYYYWVVVDGYKIKELVSEWTDTELLLEPSN